MSSSDLYLDYDLLRGMRDDIRHLAELMERPCREMADVEGSAMGVARLIDRMDDFGGEWEYGIGQLAEFAESASTTLDTVIDAFQTIDEGLEQALRNAGQRAS
jgi:hypothetical protein